ncbi:amidase [Rhizobium sp. WYJ-E13]|uniref:amidase n=1 Tax=Rhizobium sp. WYJ-E13 TaxID=2849093 RepID=UPI001C1EFD06|nr:amidase [Rhizobium sp. WYJ-E13]QWW71078.1 amidase [Rhizobium sp. WYJ-E13]
MEDIELRLDGSLSVPPNLISSKAIIYLRYQQEIEGTLPVADDGIVIQALRQLENNAAHIADVVTETAEGRKIPNAWGADFIAGPLGSPLAHAISTRPETVGLGEDVNGQLLVAASMSGVIGFYAPRIGESMARGRLSFLGHDVHDVRHAWIKSLSADDESLRLYDADDGFDRQSSIAMIVPRVHLAKGRFWDTVHFDARTNYALAIREFEKAGIEVIPTENLITEECRIAAALVSENPLNAEGQQKLQDLRSSYQLPVTDDIFLLPTSGLAAPLMAEWPLTPGRYDPDPFETVMPVFLSDRAAITVPNGFSVEGLPMGLTLAGPVTMLARLLMLAQWFCKATNWPTIPERPSRYE